jgi:hypothetical protein
MKIESIKIYLLSNALHLQFALEALNLMEQSDPGRLKIAGQYEVLKTCVEREDACYKIIRKSDLSILKEDSDHSRDTAVIGIKDAVKSSLRHFDTEVREAAQRIKIVLDAYDKPQPLIKMPYDAETVSINNLLQELDGKYAADVQKTGLPAWVEELRLRNDAFDQLAKAYNKQQAEKPSFRPKDVRRDTDKAYQDVLTLIKAYLITDEETAYVPFLTGLNTLVKHYNDLLAQHLGRIRKSVNNE